MKRNVEKAFTDEGFSNWKKGTERFKQHENSEGHKDALLVNHQRQQNNVVTQIHVHANEIQAKNQKCFLITLSSLRYLLRQGQAIRGHDEIEGNLRQLLYLRSEDMKELKEWIVEGKYLSVEIINELIMLIGHHVLRRIIDDVKKATHFAIMADETRDISNKEQLAVCVRWVDGENAVHEDLFGVVHVVKTDAENITCAIKDVLARCSLPMEACKGQAYDGAAAMMGHLNGVGTRIQREVPAAFPIHCFAHCLQLCLQTAASDSTCIRDILSLTSELNSFLKNSPKRQAIFQTVKAKVCPDAANLRPLCPTRWTVRAVALQSILDNYTALQDALEEISSERDDHGAKAKGFLSTLERFSTFFGARLGLLVFGITEGLSSFLQSKDVSVGVALKQSECVLSFLMKERSDAAFDKFYEKIVLDSHDRTTEPSLPRQRRQPKRQDEDSTAHTFKSPKDFYRREYFNVFDTLISEICRRFNQASLSVPASLETLLVDGANGKNPKATEEMKSLYGQDVDFGKLEHQLALLPDVVQGADVKKVTSVRSLVDILLQQPAACLMSEVITLCKIYLTIPITSATAERTFSALRRMKSYLRATMTQQRLNNVLIPHCHKSRTDELNLKEIAHDFFQKNDRRLAFFGNIL